MPLQPRPFANAPLSALRAFEAAGRHGSFLRAAEELSVTPGAIAQQVKKLEAWAGGRLFDRHAHGVTLTALGRQVLPDLTRAFHALGQAAQALLRPSGSANVRIAALPAVAQLWLSPRLTSFRKALPDVELSIQAVDTCPPPSQGAWDLAIYPEPTAPKGVELRVIADNALLPVAAAGVAREIIRPQALAAATLIHDAVWNADWQNWVHAYGLEGIDTNRGPAHSLYSIAVERCIAGDGVLIGHTALVGRLLDNGTLSAPFPDMGISGPPICLAIAPARSGDQVIDRVARALSAAA